MEARELKQSDLVGILGSKGVTSEVINGILICYVVGRKQRVRYERNLLILECV